MKSKINNLEANMHIEIDLERIDDKEIYCHYFDIRTNGLNEKDWRRSFSINQLLYGMILYAEKNHKIETFDEIMKQLRDKYADESLVLEKKPYAKVYNKDTGDYEDWYEIFYKDGTSSIVKEEA